MNGRGIGIIFGIVVIGLVVAVIFPRKHPEFSVCPSNLRQIGAALKMYNYDHGGYPETLAGYVQYDTEGKVIPFDQSKGSALVPNYVSSTYAKVFHCPQSPTMSMTAVAEVMTNGKMRKYYAYDSYDVYSPECVDDTARLGPDALRYTREWAKTVSDVGKYQPYPKGLQDNEKLRKHDYKRQLIKKNPRADTVVTWCSYHGNMNGYSAPMLFEDGHVMMIPAYKIEGPNGCKWRVNPDE